MLRLKSQLTSILIVAFFFLTYSSSAQLSADSFLKAKNSGTAKFIYVFDGIPGFVEEQDGQVIGIVVDIMRNFERFLETEKGISVSSEFLFAKDGDFQNFMSDVKSGTGGVFGLSNISIREDRKKDFRFSPPYMDNVSLLVSNSSVETLGNLSDVSFAFDGMTAYTLEGSSYHKRLIDLKENSAPSMKIEFLSSEAEIISRIGTDEKAFGILDVNYYLEILSKKLNIKRHPVGDIKGDQFGIIMPKSSDWEPLITEFFDSGFIDSNEYSQIITENLGNSARRLLDSFK